MSETYQPPARRPGTVSFGVIRCAQAFRAAPADQQLCHDRTTAS